ncbi:MAG: hypothetical protein ACI809_002426 [Candidatus Azotimanducaceae bacterium]|jgi:hypothetical protein
MLRQSYGYLSLRPFYEVWAARKPYFDGEFREFVNSLEAADYDFIPE